MTSLSVSGPVLLAVQLCALYVMGSYAMDRLGAIGSGSKMPFIGRLLFYVLVAPGVILHESAHYLACKLTSTPVGKFVPFAPSTDASGRTTLGYVEHGRRNPVTAALIGLAPAVMNPVGLVVLTALITPIRALPDPALFSSSGSEGITGVVGSVGGFFGQVAALAAAQPLLFMLWVYLALSFSLGSLPSREDLVAVPGAVFLVVTGGLIYASYFGTGFMSGLSDAAVYGISLYSLPLVVAGATAAVAFAASFSSRA